MCLACCNRLDGRYTWVKYTVHATPSHCWGLYSILIYHGITRHNTSLLLQGNGTEDPGKDRWDLEIKCRIAYQIPDPYYLRAGMCVGHAEDGKGGGLESPKLKPRQLFWFPPVKTVLEQGRRCSHEKRKVIRRQIQEPLPDYSLTMR